MDLNVERLAEIRSARGPVLVLRTVAGDRVIRLDRDRISLGRDPGCDVVLDQDGVADRHCILQRSEGGGFEIFHLATGFATERNGLLVEAAELGNGDDVRFGSVGGLYVDPTADVMPVGMQLLLGVPLAPPPQPPAKSGESFSDALLDALKRTPWVLISAALHALLYVTLLQLTRDDGTAPPEMPVVEVDMAQLDELDSDENEVEELVTPEPEDEEIETPEIPDENPFFEGEEEEDFEDLEAPDPVSGEPVLGPGSHSGHGGDKVGGSAGGATAGVGERLRGSIGRLKASGLDLVFVIDATGSMDQELAAAKQRVSDMIMLIESCDIEFRLGVVAFRDKGDDYVVRSMPLTGLRYKAVDFLDQLRAAGGGDTPEAVYEGLEAATRMRWSRKADKVVVLVGDAPPHERTENKLARTLRSFTKQHEGHVHTIFAETAASSYDGGRARKAFQAIAEAGAGSKIDLQNEELLVEEILLLAFGAEDRKEIRKLLEDIQKGIKGRILRRRLEKKEPGFATRLLRKSPLDPLVPFTLLRMNDVKFAPAYLEVLADQSVSISNRWLATVLLRRLLVFVGRYQDLGPTLHDALDDFNPELPRSKQSRLVAKIAKGMYDAGLLTGTDEASSSPR